MASMRSDKPFKAWLVGRNRKRRMEANPQPPTIATIDWLAAPPATGSVDTDYTATWSGGMPPYRAVITGPDGVVKEQFNYLNTITLNVSEAGDYTWSISDSFGNLTESTTTIS